MSNWAEDDSFWDEPAPEDGGATAGNDSANNNTNGGSASQKGPVCPQCGSRDIEPNPSSGESVCVRCGVVVEENCMVSTVEFAEGAGGSHSVVGQFVSNRSSTAYSSRFGFSRNSRELTLMRGRRRIEETAARLRLSSSHVVDVAVRMYGVAVERNFTQGRKSSHVTAACLYAACRVEKSQHMLIDFSDALGVNVYALGACFLKFRRVLGMDYGLPVVDPALYVYRFAAHLDLGDGANAVAFTALRIVGRMNRDWISRGRRPAGVCAAALLLASRAHGFDRDRTDVTRVLRVCGVTVRRRLRDFESTPSSSLTLDQFHAVDLETEADPPAFTRNRIREARARAILGQDRELLESGALDDPRDGTRKTKWRSTKRKPSETRRKKAKLYESLYDEVHRDLQNYGNNDGNGDGDNNDNNDNDGDNNDNDDNDNDKDNNDDDGDANADEEQANEGDVAVVANNDEDASANTRSIVARNDDSVGPATVDTDGRGGGDDGDDPLMAAYPVGHNARPLVLHDRATALERAVVATPKSFRLGDWKREMPEDDADEMEALFRDDDEVAQKEAIFNTIHADYLRKKALERGEEEEKRRRNGGGGDDDGTPSSKQTRRKKGSSALGDATIEEAVRETVGSRKTSRKINYEAISSLFDEEGDFDTDLLDDRETAPATTTGADGDDEVMFQNV